MIEGLTFIGRFHPVLLHLPIGIFIFVFGLEILGRIRKDTNYKDAISMGLLLGLLTSVATCISGLLLANGGDYEGDLVDQHKWMGIGMTVAAAILYLLNYQLNKRGKSSLYFPLFSLFMILLTITGHKGGSITHGEGFLWEDTGATSEVTIADINEASAYGDIIKPILKAKCVSCHNTSKSKGKLLMTSPEDLLKGGDSGPALVAGDAKKSIMMNRIHLPIDEKEHMPPKSKKQLSDDEIALLNWWIEEDADFTALVGQIKQTEPIAAILQKYAQPKDAYSQLNIKPVAETVITGLNTKGIPAAPLAMNSPFIDINLAHKQTIKKSLINKLSKIEKQLSVLDLAFSNVDDKMLSGLGNFDHLRNLQLQKTKITDKSIERLKGLEHLKILNLYGTDVTDKIIPIIKELPSLKTIYLLETQVSEAGIAELKKDRPLMAVNHNYDLSIFEDRTLKAPLIVSESDLFIDSLLVELALSYKDIKLHYTLDGSEPDSTSTTYTQPIILRESTLLKVMSTKQGWGNSEVAQRQFIRTSHEFEDMKLATLPDGKYQAKGAATLYDLKKGTLAFTKGGWLGFEGKHMEAILDFGQLEEFRSVTISALDAADAWIFKPQGMKVWTSIDGQNYTLKTTVSYPSSDNIYPASINSYSEDIGLTNARYIKLEVQSQLKNPDWHPTPGGKSWLFLDEVHVN